MSVENMDVLAAHELLYYHWSVADRGDGNFFGQLFRKNFKIDARVVSQNRSLGTGDWPGMINVPKCFLVIRSNALSIGGTKDFSADNALGGVLFVGDCDSAFVTTETVFATPVLTCALLHSTDEIPCSATTPSGAPAMKVVTKMSL